MNENKNDNENIFGDVIYAYTREDAINDNTLLEVNDTAREAGIKFPVAITKNLYHKYINPKTMPTGQDEKGRLWDLLSMFRFNVKNSEGSKLYYKVKFSGKLIDVIASVEPKSMTDPNPAITICLPEDN